MYSLCSIDIAFLHFLLYTLLSDQTGFVADGNLLKKIGVESLHTLHGCINFSRLGRVVVGPEDAPNAKISADGCSAHYGFAMEYAIGVDQVVHKVFPSN